MPVMAVAGINKTNEFLIRYNVRINALAKKAVATSCFRVEENAKIDAPADSGRLRNSIRPIYSEGGLVGDVGTNVKYAKFMEFGTAQLGKFFNKNPGLKPASYQYGAKHNVPAKYLKRWAGRVLGDPKLAYPVARLIRGESRRPPGLFPRPFLMPNFIKERPRFVLAMKKIIRTAGSSGFRGG